MALCAYRPARHPGCLAPTTPLPLDSQITGGMTYTFTSWSDSGTLSHTITVPSYASTYTATYRGPRRAHALSLCGHVGLAQAVTKTAGPDHGLLKKNSREFLGLRNLQRSCCGKLSSGGRPVGGTFRVGLAGFRRTGSVMK